MYSFSEAAVRARSAQDESCAGAVRSDAGLVTLGCNIHDDMVGYILVVDTPYFGKTDSSGRPLSCKAYRPAPTTSLRGASTARHQHARSCTSPSCLIPGAVMLPHPCTRRPSARASCRARDASALGRLIDPCTLDRSHLHRSSAWPCSSPPRRARRRRKSEHACGAFDRVLRAERPRRRRLGERRTGQAALMSVTTAPPCPQVFHRLSRAHHAHAARARDHQCEQRR